MMGHSENGNEYSGSIKVRKFLDYRANLALLKTLFHEISYITLSEELNMAPTCPVDPFSKAIFF